MEPIEAPSRELRESLRPWYGRGAASLAGCAAGLYGALAGWLIGTMIDEALQEGRLRRFLRFPGRDPGPEPVPGMLAVAGLALHADWGLAGSLDDRARILEEIARASMGPVRIPGGKPLGRLLSAARHRKRRAWAARAIAASLAVQSVDQGGLCRSLALRGGAEAARRMLCVFAWRLAAREGRQLDHGREELIRGRLADSGLDPATLLQARKACFPAYRDAWEILGIERGADCAAVRQAWRRRSKELHPDLRRTRAEPVEPVAGLMALGGEDALIPAEPEFAAAPLGEEGDSLIAEFRELREAYAFLLERCPAE